MIFRSSMRRGISLEVIVEEDDNAEVSLDPRLQIFENDLDLSSSSSATSSCSGHEEKEELNWNSENGVRDNYEKLKEEKEKWRQKKETDERWRRLGKQRSLSCETLTILDVGDDNLSQEQWEEEARDWDLEEENHIDQSISRRRILQSSMGSDGEISFRDEEDTNSPNPINVEPEVHCMDDDDPYDSKIDFDEESEEEADMEKESDDENAETYSNFFETFKEIDPILDNTLSKGPAKAFHEPWPTDHFSLDSDTWITVGELTDDIDKENKPTEETKKQKEVTFSDEVQILESLTNSDVSDLSLPPTEDPKDPDPGTPDTTESIRQQKSSDETSKDVINDSFPTVKMIKDIFDKNININPKPTMLEKLKTSKSSPLIMVVEKRPQQSNGGIKKEALDSSESKSTNNRTKNAAQPTAKHNKEVHLDELPAPHTVASVRQLFECLPASINNFHKTHSLGRFDHVRSNPSSKILRFDRDKSTQKSSMACLATKLAPKEQITCINRGSNSLPRMVRTASPVKETSARDNNHVTSSHFTISRSATISLRPSHDSLSTGIFLRKPTIMSRFNVKKALQENPRYFHIRMEDKMKDESDKGANTNISKECDSIETKYFLSSQNQQRELQNLIPTGRQHWLRDTIDRSDAESLSSDSSEDSGVTKDFNSSILSKFSSSKNTPKNQWPQDGQFCSDPSFKWIDPAVLAKIRAVGTTVIYFGPRHHRPNTKCSNFTSSLFREKSANRDCENRNEINGDFILKRKEEPNKRKIEEKENTINIEKQYTQVPPRIVGVLRKAKPETTETERKINTIKKASSQDPKSTSRMTNGAYKVKKKESQEANSIVYDFTRK